MATPSKQRPDGFDPANDHESRASTVISIAVTFAALSSIFTGLRLYTRLRILRIFCTDDGAILLAQVREPNEVDPARVLLAGWRRMDTDGV